LASRRTKTPFFTSTVWNGPEPMIGAGFWKLFPASAGLILLQICSGRMGIQSPSILALGFEHVNTTCVASVASTLSMKFT
jgi:hypothetical protein